MTRHVIRVRVAGVTRAEAAAASYGMARMIARDAREQRNTGSYLSYASTEVLSDGRLRVTAYDRPTIRAAHRSIDLYARVTGYTLDIAPDAATRAALAVKQEAE